MHKGLKCIQTLWDHEKKIPFVENYKECVICATLREKPHFRAYPDAKKGECCACSGALKILPRDPKNANPSGLSQKNVYSVERLRFCREGGNFSLRGVRWVPQKSADFGATAPA